MHIRFLFRFVLIELVSTLLKHTADMLETKVKVIYGLET